MNVDVGIWGKLSRVAIGLFVVALILIVAKWYLPVIKKNEHMRQEILRLDTKTQKEKEINKQLKAATESLQKDPKAVERLARRRLGYAKPDEKVVIFGDSATNAIVPR